MKTNPEAFLSFSTIITLILSSTCCSSLGRMAAIKKEVKSAQLSLKDEWEIPKISDKEQRDTLIVRSIDGKEVTVMRAIRDDDGSMVANQVLQAAKVEARFRNVAERHGSVDLEFMITVPRMLIQKDWQLRYQPVMYMLGDSVNLRRLFVTGKDFRKRQLRGYEQYEKFLARIAQDSLHLVDIDALEIFLRRNIPQIYAFKGDSTFVSDEQFLSAFGVSQKQAIEHYTRRFLVRRNSWRIARKNKRFRQFVKSPLLSDGIILDTVLNDYDRDFVYNYVQKIHTVPRLKKVDIVLGGEVFQQEKKIYEIDRSDPLSFYISSVSAFVDDSERFLTRITERQVNASSSYRIDFRQGRCELDPQLEDNESKIREISQNLRALMTNETFVLDSITITAAASPEGSVKSNTLLSRKRSESVTRYFSEFARTVKDSLKGELGYRINLDERNQALKSNRDDAPVAEAKFISGWIGEDWSKLCILVEEDKSMTTAEKDDFRQMCENVSDADERERLISKRKYFDGIKENLYPLLRSVNFSFHLHRRGMQKDTIHTTELDTVYMAGVQAIKDRDYTKAIEILRPYNDYNTAVAYCAKDFNHSALAILRNCPRTAAVNYMTALIQARLGNKKQAIELYLQSCEQDGRFVFRGNLDPEISALKKEYSLNSEQ